MFVRARSLTQAAVREINSVCLQSNQCVGMATQLGGNARQRAASERKECTALLLCLCEREQESNLTSERGEAGARCARVYCRGCSAEIKSFGTERKCTDVRLDTGNISHDPRCTIGWAEAEKYRFAVPHHHHNK